MLELADASIELAPHAAGRNTALNRAALGALFSGQKRRECVCAPGHGWFLRAHPLPAQCWTEPLHVWLWWLWWLWWLY